MHTHALRRATTHLHLVMALLFAMLLSACGGSGDSSPAAAASGNVGPAGATVSSADGQASLTVPAGAVNTPIAVTLAPASDGFSANPLIVPGTTYRLDAPDTALVSEATLEIAVPPGVIAAAARPEPRVHALGAALSLGDFISCSVPVVSGVTPPAGTRCYFVGTKFDDLLYCKYNLHPKAVGSTIDLGRIVVAGLTSTSGQFYVGWVLVCEVPAAPTPQIANLSLTPPGLIATLLNPAKTRASAKLGALGHGFYGMLFDAEAPVVTMSAVTVSDGNGNGHFVISGNTSDNVGIFQVQFHRLDGIDPVTLQPQLTALALFAPGAYSYTSPVMPLADIDGKAYLVRAGDRAGNVGSAVVVLSTGAPTVSAFNVSPAAVPFGGGNVTLTWSAANAATVTIDNGVGDVTGLASKTVSVTTPTTFTLTATNPTGTVTATAAVTVAALPAPTITSFTATPASLPAGGGAVTLNWATSGAASVAIDNGIGVVAGTSKVVNVTANTTFTLTASNASGSPTAQTNVVVATSGDRFVDPVAGLDTNSCSQAAPCKTIAKAMIGAPAGSAVYLADGNYPSSNSATIPDGVALRATHPGAATLNFVTLTATGSASLNGLVFDVQGQSCSSLTAAASTGTATLAITGVLFKCAGALNLGGSVKAVMTPGLLANGQYTVLTNAYTQLFNLSGSAELLIQGGIIDFNNFGQGAFGPGMLNTGGSSKLTLDAVTVRNLKQQAFVIPASASVTLRNGTVIDHVGDGGECAAGAAIVVTEHGTLTMDHAAVSNGPNAAICVASSTTPLPTIQLTQSTISGMAGAAIATTTGTSADAQLTADGLALINNGRGIYWISTTAAASLTLSNLTITGNTVGGMTVSNGALKLRGSTVSNNGAEGGVTLYGISNVDLGTSASPGGNTFTGNAGNQLNSIVGAGQTVNAVGNTWTPNVQGADANGRYSLPPAFAPVPKAGPTNGANYQIFNASTLNL